LKSEPSAIRAFILAVVVCNFVVISMHAAIVLKLRYCPVEEQDKCQTPRIRDPNHLIQAPLKSREEYEKNETREPRTDPSQNIKTDRISVHPYRDEARTRIRYNYVKKAIGIIPSLGAKTLNPKLC
jgi:hypothetical protein